MARAALPGTGLLYPARCHNRVLVYLSPETDTSAATYMAVLAGCHRSAAGSSLYTKDIAMTPVRHPHLFNVLLTFFAGAFLLWKGLSLTSDKAWNEHVKRCTAKGLYPERNAYWESSVRRARIIQIVAGVFFLVMGIVLASDPLFSPF
jgi:threonine/homoserine/homoserine lactone efflux protein